MIAILSELQSHRSFIEKGAHRSGQSTPRYQHDCDNCRFLGEYGPDDLYVCANDGKANTVIARYGDEGPQYISGLIFAHRNLTQSLVEAKRRAEELGIDCTATV